MLTPEYYEHVSDRIIELYAELDSAIVADIARRIVITGEITETAEWQLRQLQESGMVYDDILREIGRHTGQSERELRRIFKDAGIESIRNDNAVYSAAGKGKINLTAAGMQVLNAGFRKCHGSLNNLTLTTANTSQSAFINACNVAYMQVASGAFDYNTAIRKAVRTVAQNGSEVLYPSGHRDKVDVAVRRAVLTGVGQTCRTLSETNAEEMGCDLMEISAHAGARPSHAEWQGQIVSLSGRKGYLSKSDIGYGTGEGFGGWNCRHDWYPFFEGISKRNYTKESIEQLNARNIEYDGKIYTQYEISQMQRQFEREIRALKREAAALNAAAEAAAEESLKDELKADFTGVAVKLKSKETMLKQFLKETHQDRENAREQVGGFGKSEAQKAVWANKKALQLGNGNAIIGLKILDFQNELSKGNINLKLKTEKQRDHIRGDEKWRKRIDDDLKKSNTPTSMFFESTDIQKLINDYVGKETFYFKDEKQKYPVEYVTADYVVGKVWDSGKGRYVDTKRFAIRYSNKGVHLHPVKEPEVKNET